METILLLFFAASYFQKLFCEVRRQTSTSKPIVIFFPVLLFSLGTLSHVKTQLLSTILRFYFNICLPAPMVPPCLSLGALYLCHVVPSLSSPRSLILSIPLPCEKVLNLFSNPVSSSGCSLGLLNYNFCVLSLKTPQISDISGTSLLLISNVVSASATQHPLSQ